MLEFILRWKNLANFKEQLTLHCRRLFNSSQTSDWWNKGITSDPIGIYISWDKRNELLQDVEILGPFDTFQTKIESFKEQLKKFQDNHEHLNYLGLTYH